MIAQCAPLALAGDWHVAGPLFSEFDLTLDLGHRQEVLGPFYYGENKESQETWAFPLLTLSHTEDKAIDYEEYDFAYPLLTYDRFGAETRWQFLQIWSISGGRNQDDSNTRRFTIFPIYFQQRSTDPSKNYTAVFPIYGQLKNRLFRNEIEFVLFPIYSKTRKRDIVTRNMPYPFFHLRTGDGLKGWQAWPLAGHETKTLTTRTNGFGDVESIPGHDKKFILWPFWFDNHTELGTDHPAHFQALIPFYAYTRSAPRDSTSYLWPLGVTHTIDREKKYEEWDAPWPIVEFAHGEGKTTSRIWPFYSQSHSATLESDFYLWPIYKYNRLHFGALDRERTRILFFLYSDTLEKNTDTGHALHRVDFWPLYTYRRDFEGKSRLQVLSILEPVLPNNKSIERDYSLIYALWRDERNPGTGARSQSLLWNLYRRDVTPAAKKCSILFGLFQYQSSSEGRRWRICYIPFGNKPKTASNPPATP